VEVTEEMTEVEATELGGDGGGGVAYRWAEPSKAGGPGASRAIVALRMARHASTFVLATYLAPHALQRAVQLL